MNKWEKFINNQNLRTRLILWFLLIALIPIAWTTLFSYEMCKRILFDFASEHLQSLTLRQEKLLKYYFHEKQLDASEFLRDPTAFQALEALTPILARYGKNSPEYQTARLELYPVLKFRTQALGYHNLWLVTKEGVVTFSLSSAPIGQNILHSNKYAYLEGIVEKSLSSSQIHMTSLFFNQSKSSFTAFITIPLLSPEDQVVGIAVVELANIPLSQMLSGYNELGRTNLLVVFKEDNRFFVINPPQMNPQGSEEVNPTSSFGQFIQTTLTQPYTKAAHVEFHNRESLMVGRHFQINANWALITEIDEGKLLEPIHQLAYLFIVLVTITTFAVILAASHVAQKIASPILTLTKKTQILAEGDLSQRITVTSQDEIGKLGQSFNLMASKLNHLINHLDDLVEKRTKEYEIQNVKLEQTIEELRQTRDRLITQEKLASLGALTAGIAHEIKNPLNFIVNFAELSLQIEKELEERCQGLKPLLSEQEQQALMEQLNTLKLDVSKILEHGKRADSIIFNMLQHSRGTPGEKTPVNIHKLLDEYIALSYHGMRAQDFSFNVTIEKDYDLSIPLIPLVPQEMSRVILNLLSNAYYSIVKKKKQTPTASYQPTVRVSTKKETDGIVIKIWDNGLGISPEVISKLFTPFFTTKPPGEGTGLGLSLSYNIIVQGHGGTLSATSQLGEYAEFTMTFPFPPH